MAKQCWSQTVLESGSWGHSVLQTPALVFTIIIIIILIFILLYIKGVKKVRSTFQMVILICKQAASTEQFTVNIQRVHLYSL